MRNVKAKNARRNTYGEHKGEETKYVKDPKTGTIYATGRRRKYLDTKRLYKKIMKKGGL